MNSDVLKGFKDDERYKKKKKKREKEKTNENLKAYFKALITTLLVLLKKLIRWIQWHLQKLTMMTRVYHKCYQKVGAHLSLDDVCFSRRSHNS